MGRKRRGACGDWLDTERVESQRKMLLKFLNFFPLVKPTSGNLWNVNMWLL